MSIEKKQFDNENELHGWVEKNIELFFGEVLYVPGNFFISTKRNKGGKPDGFILDVKNNSWTIIESELLKHGVWEHIPYEILIEYLQQTFTSKNPDGTIRHYHLYIKNEPGHMLWINQDSITWDVEEHFFVNES